MIKKIAKFFMAMVLLVLLAGWSPIQNPSNQETDNLTTHFTQPFAFSHGQIAATVPDYKTTLPPNYTMRDYLVYLVNDVDAFWSPIMMQGGFSDPFVYYSFPALGEPIVTKCKLTDPKNPAQAFYCQLDDQLVISQEMAKQLWEGTVKTNKEPRPKYNAGDFSVAVIVAHEFAHNLQTEIGWITNTGYKTTSRSIELNADCLTGVWANSSYYKGLLDTTDIQEAMRTLSDIGQDMTAPDPTHGTPKERTDAFMLGYNTGQAARCDYYLNTKY
ncbi:putative metalloprotease [Planomicrobium sp. HSC-17F08]|nr:putative metalloprotease [Planomicrobium sp. HSC-17F08]